jgi:hypothetical protein
MHTLFARRPAPLTSDLKLYAAIITMNGVFVSLARKLKIAEDRAITLHQTKNIIGVVRPRLCTERSMHVEAERILSELFNTNAPTSVDGYGDRSVFGGYEAIREEIDRIAILADIQHRNEQSASAAAAERSREGQRHLNALFGNNARERRQLVASRL